LPTERAVKVVPNVAEVRGCGTVETAPGLLGVVVRGHLRHGRTKTLAIVHLENMELSLAAIAFGDVSETELVRKRVDDAPLGRRQRARESHAFARIVLFEQ
jgi:hypothetical protein